MIWEQFEQSGVVLIGTIRKDGSPRISCVEPCILDGVLIAYWTAAFEQQKFRFTSPRFIEQELQDVQTVPLRERARTLLTVIARGLGIARTAGQPRN